MLRLAALPFPGITLYGLVRRGVFKLSSRWKLKECLKLYYRPESHFLWIASQSLRVLSLVAGSYPIIGALS